MRKKHFLICIGIIILVAGVIYISQILKVNNHERITYHGRIYKLSNLNDPLPQIHIDNIKISERTGEFLNGLEVYGGSNSMTPTLLCLKMKNGKFLVYGLSGGP